MTTWFERMDFEIGLSQSHWLVDNGVVHKCVSEVCRYMDKIMLDKIFCLKKTLVLRLFFVSKKKLARFLQYIRADRKKKERKKKMTKFLFATHGTLAAGAKNTLELQLETQQILPV